MWLTYSVWGNDPLFSLLNNHFENGCLGGAASHVLETTCTRRDTDRLLDILRKSRGNSGFAVDTLARLKEPRAVPVFIEFLSDRSYAGAKASFSLQRITGQDFGNDPDQWRNWWENNKERLLQERLQDR